MRGTTAGKRPRAREDVRVPAKKRRKGPRQKEYHSESEDDEPEPEQDQSRDQDESQDQMQSLRNGILSDADDDDDLLNVTAVDGASSGPEEGASSSDEDGGVRLRDHSGEREKGNGKKQVPRRQAKEGDEDSDGTDQPEDDSADGGAGQDSDSDGQPGTGRRPKSKRNDPAAFAASMSKLLSTKLSVSRRQDPVLARSASAQTASRDAADSALEAKVRRQMKERRRLAAEKGRVRDVLTGKVSTGGAKEGDPDHALALAAATATASAVQQTERRLRKVAQRGVVKLFNAVRAAQVAAAEAETETRGSDGAVLVGSKRKEAKVQEMTKKGFLELVASGGGRLKKGRLEEA